jgi:hypothetical protein|tara:strand:+ start:396 stop:836 length:441 start_codon:yes stop_codon:yes gene_type:complete
MAKINFDISKRLDITVRQGDSFKLELTLKDSSDNALNLYGDTFHLLVRSASPAAFPMGTSGFIMSPAIIIPVEQTLTDDETTTASTATGKVKFEASAADMKQMLVGVHTYDIQYVDASDTVDVDGNARTILYGNFIVKSDVSVVTE